MDNQLIERIAFWVFSLVAIASALVVITKRNPVPGAVALVMTFLAVGGLYMTLGATFLTATQILVYAGAIMVLFLFVIMLLNLEHDPEDQPGVVKVLGAALAGAFLFGALALIAGSKAPESESLTDGSGLQVGQMFGGEYLFAFEMASLLLLIAMVGAIVIARRQKSNGNSGPTAETP